MSFFDVLKFYSPDISNFPTTRYHGSKRKLLSFLHERLAEVPFTSALDLFSGSGIVSLLMRQMNKQVVANDYLPYNQNTANLFLTLTPDQIPSQWDVEDELISILTGELHDQPLVTANFAGIYFTDTENDQIDRFCQNLGSLSAMRRSLYIYGMGQALLMKRPFGLFHRNNLYLRQAVMERSFGNGATWSRPILDLAAGAIAELRNIGWQGPTGSARCLNTVEGLDRFGQFDLIYIDPPYIGAEGASVDYADFYHFLTGLVDYPAFTRSDRSRRHAPVLDLPSNWREPKAAMAEMKSYLRAWPDATLVVSYRSDGNPTPEQFDEVLSSDGRQCEVHTLDYQYVLAQRKAHELLFISYSEHRRS